MSGVARGEGRAPRQNNAGNLGIAQVNRSSGSLSLGSQDRRLLRGLLVEVQYASLKIFAQDLRKCHFDFPAAAAW